MVGIGEIPPPFFFSPSEAEASLMAVDVKRLLPQHPRGHIIAPVSSHYPPPPRGFAPCGQPPSSPLQRRGAGHRRRRPPMSQRHFIYAIIDN